MTEYLFHPSGMVDVLARGRAVFENARAGVTYHLRDGTSRGVSTMALRDADALIGSDDFIALALRRDGDTLTLRVTNHGVLPIQLDELTVLDCDTARGGAIHLPPAHALRYFHHGWQSWSPVAVRDMTETEAAFQGDDYFEKHLPYGAAGAKERTGNAFMLIGNAGSDAEALLLGFTDSTNQFTQIRCEVANRVTRVRAIAYADGAQLEPGAAFESEPLMMAFGAAGDLYDEYARRVAARMGRRGTRATLQGWCSWYYYFNSVTADDIRVNLRAMQAQNLPLDVVIVDDGYMTAVGDWTRVDAEKFPQGMKAIADEIHAAGKLAGIWLAPFGLQADSETAQQRPEFLLCDASGAPVHAWMHWDNPIYALDLTRADVQDWLAELVQTICDEWGYDVLKLDFLFAGAQAGEHADAAATRAQAYRRGLETIARAAGDTKVLMGCGAPIAASVGLVDTMRVGQDVSMFWEPLEAGNDGAPSTRLAARNTLLRAPLNQHWWLNDGDCVMLRARGDVCMLTRHERRTLASIAALTGSALLDSDNVANFKAAARADLRRVLPALENTARVRAWFADDAAQPSQFALALQDGAWVLAAVNWDKRARAQVIEFPDAQEYRVYDFWNKKDLGVHRHHIKVPKLARHETIVLHCIPASENRAPKLKHIGQV